MSNVNKPLSERGRETHMRQTNLTPKLSPFSKERGTHETETETSLTPNVSPSWKERGITFDID